MEIQTYFHLPNSRTRVISIYQRSFGSLPRGVISQGSGLVSNLEQFRTSQNYAEFVVAVLSDFWLMDFACRNPAAL